MSHCCQLYELLNHFMFVFCMAGHISLTVLPQCSETSCASPTVSCVLKFMFRVVFIIKHTEYTEVSHCTHVVLAPAIHMVSAKSFPNSGCVKVDVLQICTD